MESLPVYLRLSKKSHPLYEELLQSPPKGITYIQSQQTKQYFKKESVKDKVRNKVWRGFTQVFPNFFPMRTSAAIIHSTNNIFPLTRKPFVFDIESEYGLFSFKYTHFDNGMYRTMMKRYLSLNNCKTIIAWSEICKKNLITLLGKKYASKIKVVYPAHKIPLITKKKQTKGPTKLLFVSRKFEYKGVYELLAAFDRIKDTYNCTLTIISDIPKSLLRTYKHDTKVNLIQATLKREETEKYFADADIFVYPTRIDSFGFVLVEAMAHKLPVISTRLYAIPEIVTENKTGLLIDPLIPWKRKKEWKDDYDYLAAYQQAYESHGESIVNALVGKLTYLLEHPTIAQRMGEAGFKEVQQGKFSITNRNKKLQAIYHACLE